MNNSNIILTGVPRSGTTLTCHLLNKVPNVVALHEPMNVGSFSEMADDSVLIRHIESYFADTRASLIKDGTALSKQHNGEVPDNPFTDEFDPSTGVRKSRLDSGVKSVRFDNILNDDFSLVIKHPAAFTALLPQLVAAFTVFAVIRNPLSVLMSWNTLDIPVSRGRLPMAERIDVKLKDSLDAIPDKHDRQVFLLGWLFSQYKSHLPESAVIYYEDMIASGGEVLSRVVSVSGVIDDSLKSKNNNSVYDQSLKSELRNRLLATADDWSGWDFYSKEAILSL